ncbi:MAG: hypothetical protein R6W95_06080 [Desulfosarcina sp.]
MTLLITGFGRSMKKSLKPGPNSPFLCAHEQQHDHSRAQSIFASSDGIANARYRHLEFPDKLGLGEAQLAGTPVAK